MARSLLFVILLVVLLPMVPQRAPSENQLLSAKGRHWVVHLPPKLARLRPPADWATEADRRLESTAERLGVALPVEPLHAYLYSSSVEKNQAAGDDDPASLQPERRAIHWLLAPDGSLADPRGEALLLLHLTWGEPASERLAEAVARYAVATFHGAPLPAWAARIARQEEPYPLSLALGGVPPAGAAALSPLDADALTGAWVEHLAASRGKPVLHALWTAPFSPGNDEALVRALGKTWPDLEKEWQAWLASLPAPPAEAPVPRTLPFLRGISFSHEVHRQGYGSDTAAEQLTSMHALGATAVAVVPYAFTRAPGEATVHYRGTDENDARVARTIEQARRLGMRVMLKPQLWDPGRFTGDVVFAQDADFDRWFADYRRWMLHQARLAALERVDLLVIGTELGGLADDPRHEAAWRGLIKDLRRVYSGPLTYAANWANDFEALPFWDALDVLGVNMYYPLAGPGELPQAGSPRLRELRSRLAAIARRHGKPIVFTEVGYAASAAAAVEPWKEDNAPSDPAMQARCYQTVFEAFYREPWLGGLFWWKWPSHGRGSMQDDSFNPLGKPAFQVLAQWYGKAGR